MQHVGNWGGGERVWGTWRSVALAVLFVATTLALVLTEIGTGLAQPKFPALTGRIVDEARILSPADIQELARTVKELEGKSSDQIVVYVAKSLQGYEIEEFGYQLGRAWKLGQEGTNNGILLIVAPNERKVRIEVGRGLEGQMTDLLSGTIIRNAILPAFRRGDFPGGIKAGVRDIKDVLLGDAEAVKERARSLKPRQSSGDWLPLIIILIFVVFWIMAARRQMIEAQKNPHLQRRRRMGDGNVIIIPGGWGGSSSWPPSGGGWGGGSSSDDNGGFSGGGGDFGGGGASGSW